MKKKREPNITRIDYGRGKSWWVRICRTDAKGVKRVYSKSFADARYGSSRAAKAAAAAYRAELLQRLPDARKPRRTRAPGDFYLIETFVENTSRGIVYGYPAIKAWLCLSAGPAMTSWSIETWGRAEAIARCRRWAQEKCRSEGLRARERPAPL